MEQNSSRLPFVLVGGLLIVVVVLALLIFTVGAPPAIPTPTVPPTATPVPTSVPPATVDANAEVPENSPQGICNALEPGELTEQSYPEPEQVLEDVTDYYAILCTDVGAVFLDLYEDLTPITVNNFVFLAQNGYYDGTTFHRVITDFMAQAGDPTATGSGGPGYQFADEFVGFLTFDRPGLLAMANAGPGTNGSQFFITTAPTEHLNFRHTIFGEVLNGYENVTTIRLRDPNVNPEFDGTTLRNVVIITDLEGLDVDIPEATPATQADVEVALGNMESQLLNVSEKDGEGSGSWTTEELIETAPDDIAEDFASYLESHNHAFRVASRLLNAECDQQLFFGFYKVTIDAFASAEDAQNALADDFLTSLAETNGFTYDDVTNVYTQAVEYCDDSEATYVMRRYTRGRYLLTVEGSIADSILLQVPITTVVDEGLERLAEQFMAPVFLPEIRS